MKFLFDKLLQAKLNPNQYYVLYCIRHNMEAAFVNISLEIRSLKLLGYLDKQCKITPLGDMLLDALDNIYPAKEKSISKPVEADMIQLYLDMWPAIKLPTGKYARTDKKNLESAFKWFFSTHSYSWDTVLKATEMYVEEYRRNNYKFMRTSQYFIKKSDSDKNINSELANYCSLIESGGPIHNPHTFTDKVV